MSVGSLKGDCRSGSFGFESLDFGRFSGGKTSLVKVLAGGVEYVSEAEEGENEEVANSEPPENEELGNSEEEENKFEEGIEFEEEIEFEEDEKTRTRGAFFVDFEDR